MKVRLYGLPGSHPTMATQAMLEYKGIEFSRVDLVPFLAKVVLRRPLGFPRNTVPAITIDGRRVQGSREIARELDRVQPEPPLFPTGPGKRTAVEEAERWGEEELQHPVRQIVLWAMHANGASTRSYMDDSRMGVPIGLAARLTPPFIAAGVRVNEASDEVVRANLAGLDGALQKVDEWIAAGVLDGEELNAADFQIGASVRLAMTLQDLRPPIDGRPAGRLARRAVPRFPGDAPPVLPSAWLRPLRSHGPA
ncbi:MAG TPA: glutathione S-transferase N-terminal domain-containing protein [Solirubrobacterales bacterium]